MATGWRVVDELWKECSRCRFFFASASTGPPKNALAHGSEQNNTCIKPTRWEIWIFDGQFEHGMMLLEWRVNLCRGKRAWRMAELSYHTFAKAGHGKSGGSCREIINVHLREVRMLSDFIVRWATQRGHGGREVRVVRTVGAPRTWREADRGLEYAGNCRTDVTNVRMLQPRHEYLISFCLLWAAGQIAARTQQLRQLEVAVRGTAAAVTLLCLASWIVRCP